MVEALVTGESSADRNPSGRLPAGLFGIELPWGGVSPDPQRVSMGNRGHVPGSRRKSLLNQSAAEWVASEVSERAQAANRLLKGQDRGSDRPSPESVRQVGHGPSVLQRRRDAARSRLRRLRLFASSVRWAGAGPSDESIGRSPSWIGSSRPSLRIHGPSPPRFSVLLENAPAEAAEQPIMSESRCFTRENG